MQNSIEINCICHIYIHYFEFFVVLGAREDRENMQTIKKRNMDTSNSKKK